MMLDFIDIVIIVGVHALIIFLLWLTFRDLFSSNSKEKEKISK